MANHSTIGDSGQDGKGENGYDAHKPALQYHFSIAEMARQSAGQGHEVSARDAYLMASNYYRAALISMLPYDRENPDLRNQKF